MLYCIQDYGLYLYSGVVYKTGVCSGNKGIQDGIDKVNRPVPECSFHRDQTISISVRGMLTRRTAQFPLEKYLPLTV